MFLNRRCLLARITSIYLLVLLACCCSMPALAQKKKAQPPAKEKTTTPPPDLIERTPVRPPKKDTVQIVYETIPAKQPKKNENEGVSLFSVKETVITLPSKKDTIRNKKHLQIVYDTVRYVKKPKGDDILPPAKVSDNVFPAGADKIVKVPVDTIKEKSKEGFCSCISLGIKAQDSINFEDYVNYSFTFKNNCKSEVYVYSYAFRFTVADYFGRPAKRIRRIDFVKRFDHPEYVRIDPGETYEYRFADDPFFEYELSRGSQYRFTFIHSNTTNKSKIAPAKTYMCNEHKEQIVTVR